MAGNPTRIPNAKVPVTQDDGSLTLPWRLWAQNLTGAQDPGVLTVNNLSGDVTLAPGANIDITKSGNTLTISSPDPDQTGFVTVSGYPAAGQNTVWAGGSSITAGPARTPWTDNYGFNYSTTLGNDTIAAFADTSTITGFTGPGYYASFDCVYDYTGVAAGGSGQQLFGGRFIPVFGGTGTLDNIYGMDTSVGVQGTVTTATGNRLAIYVGGSSLTTGYGAYVNNYAYAGGTIGTWYSYEDAADLGTAASTSWGYHQTATNHPNYYASTSEFVLSTKHDYLTASELVGTDASKNLVSGNLTGDLTTAAFAATLATVNSNVGSFTNANITVNAKGLITAASSGSGGSGTVTSIGVLAPLNPVTITTTGNVGFPTETANTVLAGPTTGAAATPAFRALVAADLPAGSGTVTSVSLSAPLGGGTVTTSGTLGTSSFTAHGFVIGAGSSALSVTAAPTNGQIPIGSTGNDPVPATITAGSGITVTNGAGSITIKATGGGGGGGSLILLNTLTASSSASLIDTTSLTSTYDVYQIEIVNLRPANNNDDFQLEFSTNGGSTWDTTSGHYGWEAWRWFSGGTGANGTTATTSISLTANFSVVPNTASLGGVIGTFKLYNPSSSVFWKQTHSTVQYNATSTNTSVGFNIVGTYQQTVAVNAFRIRTVSGGNIADGVVRVYGIAQ